MALAPIVTTVTTRNGQVETTTRTTQTLVSVSETNTFDNGVIDISIIPYMRHQLINFAASGLKPNRRVWFFFDGQDVTNYVVKPDELRLTTNAANLLVQTAFTTNNGVVVSGSNVATVIQSSRYFDFENATAALQDDGTARNRARILKLIRTSGQFKASSSLTYSFNGNTGIANILQVRGGESLNTFFATAASNTIILPISAAGIANNYWGTDSSNSISLIPKKRRTHAPLIAAIGDGARGYDNVTRTLYLSNTLSALLTLANEEDPVAAATPGTDIAWSIGTTHRTDAEGKISGTFAIPAGVFRTGERVFRIIDVSDNDINDASTRAEYRFVSSGLNQTKNRVVINSTRQELLTTVDVSTRTIPPPPPEPGIWTESSGDGDGNGAGGSLLGSDPLAQTFFVPSQQYPNGIFLSSVDLFFRSKDQVIPVRIEIRPTVNGYPSSNETMPFGQAVLDSEYINVSEDATVSNNFKFQTPVFLPPGEYALVVLTDSLEYEVFVAELGSTILGSTNIVSEQPYVGSFFKSQNATTWDAIQLEDLCFRLYKCTFEPSGSVTLKTDAPAVDLNIDTIYTHVDDSKLPNTSIRYTHSFPGYGYTTYELDNEVVPSGGRISITPTSATYNLIATMTTGDSSISPILYPDSAKFLGIQNYIDNANLAQTNFTIVRPLGGFPANTNVLLTINSVSGSGAVVYANSNTSGNLTSIVVSDGGSGYTDNVTVTVGSSNTGIISVSAETDSSGGPALAKYISRVATLAEGFDAGDLRVFLTAYKPVGTDIKVYYKVKNSNDPDKFEDKKYIEMNQKTSTGSYSGRDGFYSTAIEFEYEPIDTDLGVTYTSGTTSYTSFNQYAIKIVLLSSDTTNVPVVYDMRAIALPPVS